MLSRQASILLLLARTVMTFAATQKGPPYFTQKQKMIGSFIAWPAWHSIKLKCKADGPPPLRFQWLKDGKPLTYRRLQNNLKTNLWYLRLRDLVSSDSGDYTCVVSNPYGQVNHTYTLHVVVKARTKPLLKCGHPKNTTADIGHNATLTCIVAMSGTIPDFRWIRWNKPPRNYTHALDFDNGDYTLINPIHYRTIYVESPQESGVELRLTNLAEREFGLYTCVVSNHIGRDYQSAFLIRRKAERQLRRKPTSGITTSLSEHKPTHTSTKATSTIKHKQAMTDELQDDTTESTEPRIPLSVFVGVLSAWVSLTVAVLIWCYFRTKKSKQDKQESWM